MVGLGLAEHREPGARVRALGRPGSGAAAPPDVRVAAQRPAVRAVDAGPAHPGAHPGPRPRPAGGGRAHRTPAGAGAGSGNLGAPGRRAQPSAPRRAPLTRLCGGMRGM